MPDIYIVLQQDRHTDDEVLLFLSEEEAISQAKAFAQLIQLEEVDYKVPWIYFAVGPEGDSVRVEKAENRRLQDVTVWKTDRADLTKVGQ